MADNMNSANVNSIHMCCGDSLKLSQELVAHLFKCGFNATSLEENPVPIALPNNGDFSLPADNTKLTDLSIKGSYKSTDTDMPTKDYQKSSDTDLPQGNPIALKFEREIAAFQKEDFERSIEERGQKREQNYALKMEQYVNDMLQSSSSGNGEENRIEETKMALREEFSRQELKKVNENVKALRTELEQCLQHLRDKGVSEDSLQQFRRNYGI